MSSIPRPSRSETKTNTTCSSARNLVRRLGAACQFAVGYLCTICLFVRGLSLHLLYLSSSGKGGMPYGGGSLATEGTAGRTRPALRTLYIVDDEIVPPAHRPFSLFAGDWPHEPLGCNDKKVENKGTDTQLTPCPGGFTAQNACARRSPTAGVRSLNHRKRCKTKQPRKGRPVSPKAQQRRPSLSRALSLSPPPPPHSPAWKTGRSWRREQPKEAKKPLQRSGRIGAWCVFCRGRMRTCFSGGINRWHSWRQKKYSRIFCELCSGSKQRKSSRRR